MRLRCRSPFVHYVRRWVHPAEVATGRSTDHAGRRVAFRAGAGRQADALTPRSVGVVAADAGRSRRSGALALAAFGSCRIVAGCAETFFCRWRVAAIADAFGVGGGTCAWPCTKRRDCAAHHRRHATSDCCGQHFWSIRRSSSERVRHQRSGEHAASPRLLPRVQ